MMEKELSSSTDVNIPIFRGVATSAVKLTVEPPSIQHCTPHALTLHSEDTTTSFMINCHCQCTGGRAPFTILLVSDR